MDSITPIRKKNFEKIYLNKIFKNGPFCDGKNKINKRSKIKLNKTTQK